MSPSLLFLGLGLVAMALAPTRSAEIRVERGTSYRLEPVAGGAVGDSGTYDLTVTKEGRSGTSRTRQSGAFEIPEVGTRVLSTQSIAVAEGDQLQATLTVTWADGRVEEASLNETVSSRSPR